MPPKANTTFAEVVAGPSRSQAESTGVPPRRAAESTRPTMKGRPEVITVTPPEGTSFLDVFRNVRSVPDVAECVRTGSRIQRNTAELVLKGNADAKAVFERVKALAPEGSRTTLRLDTVRLLIRGIDMLAEKSDVASAVGGKVGEVVAEEDVTLQRYYRGDQRAFVKVHRRTANALLGEKLLIGHSRCRVELAPRVSMERVTCSRCWQKGHLPAPATAPTARHLPRSATAQDLLVQLARERGADVALLSDYHRVPANNSNWAFDPATRTAVVALGRFPIQRIVNVAEGMVAVEVNSITFCVLVWGGGGGSRFRSVHGFAPRVALRRHWRKTSKATDETTRILHPMIFPTL
ncbi:gag-like protein [Anopheles sinensis]|uniref:Gag-like protein n=1 Tax=Anopheles sinensis TaxID=74873 RepID=A0A084VBI1_ANOSI|nr:gag-like protein [Anopheles sinensis]